MRPDLDPAWDFSISYIATRLSGNLGWDPSCVHTKARQKRIHGSGEILKNVKKFPNSLTSQRRRFTHSDGITVLLSEKRRLLYKSLGIVEPASGEELGSETRFQTPGDAILTKFNQHLDFLNPTRFKGS